MAAGLVRGLATATADISAQPVTQDAPAGDQPTTFERHGTSSMQHEHQSPPNPPGRETRAATGAEDAAGLGLPTAGADSSVAGANREAGPLQQSTVSAAGAARLVVEASNRSWMQLRPCVHQPTPGAALFSDSCAMIENSCFDLRRCAGCWGSAMGPD
jgi:hypothetical protein